MHAPSPGATATLIHDLRELFKVKVVGLVLVTGWGGFYLGSMQSGISSVQRGLLDALLGIGLVSAGAGALNEALERKTDARMKRTADRPLAAGRFSLAQGCSPAWAPGLGAVWLALRTNLLTVALGAAHRLHLRGHLHAAQARHHPGHLHRRVSRRHGPHAWLDRRPRPHRVAGRGAVRHSLCLAVSRTSCPSPGSIATTTPRAGIRMLPVVQPDGWSTVVEALFYAVLMIPVSLAPWRLGMASLPYAVLAPRWAWFTWPTPSASAASCAPSPKTKAAGWPAICSRSACFICPCCSPRSCSAPPRNTEEADDDRSSPFQRSRRQAPARHRRHPGHQRGGHAVSLLADLCSSRRGRQHASSHFFPRSMPCSTASAPWPC